MEDAHAGHGAERDQSLATSLMIAGALAFPLNRWLVSRGMGHAVLHAHHH